MKKLLTITLSLLLVACLFSGCGGNQDATGSNDAATGQTVESTSRSTEESGLSMPTMPQNDNTTPSTISPTGGVDDNNSRSRGTDFGPMRNR